MGGEKGLKGEEGSLAITKNRKGTGARARKEVRRRKIAESSAVKDDDKSGNGEPKERSGRGQKADAAQPSAPRVKSVKTATEEACCGKWAA